jgi:hypothetical protein
VVEITGPAVGPLVVVAEVKDVAVVPFVMEDKVTGEEVPFAAGSVVIDGKRVPFEVQDARLGGFDAEVTGKSVEAAVKGSVHDPFRTISISWVVSRVEFGRTKA